MMADDWKYGLKRGFLFKGIGELTEYGEYLMNDPQFKRAFCEHPSISVNVSLAEPELTIECQECGRKVAVTHGTLLLLDMEERFKLIGLIFGAEWEQRFRDELAREVAELTQSNE